MRQPGVIVPAGGGAALLGVFAAVAAVVVACGPRATSSGRDSCSSMVSTAYPLDSACDGHDYRRQLVADLNGDALPERVVITACVEFDERFVATDPLSAPDSAFAWDDGEQWQAWIESSDGGRTYLFSSWVQMGRLTLELDSARPPGVILTRAEYGDTVARCRFTYRGPGAVSAELLRRR